ncbi:MAG: aldo/keto reductase, partial [Sedimentisphaerales bacterium]|nr:aldo/keto reductase [Sedimentisphaerales bacterium]NLT75969.1 aldo/keto reductase [Planctomycetota bacterium]
MKQQPSHAADIDRDCSRRRFLGAALAGAGALAAGSQWLSSAPAMAAGGKRSATDIVTLGRTGIKVSRLAQGTGYNGTGRSSAHTRLGEKEFDRLIHHGLDRGITFMDMADLYGSHAYVRHALDSKSRDKIAYLSKIWPETQYWNAYSGGAKAEIDRFRRELNTDVIDVCLLHCMRNGNWADDHERARDELDELKDKGAVRAVGVSCHDLGALKVAATHPWVDVILARINNVGREAAMDASVEEVVPVLKQARANGKVILGMKLFGAGALTSP